MQWVGAGEVDAFGERTILPTHSIGFEWLVPSQFVHADFQIVTTVPCPSRQLERRQHFALVCRSAPSVESIGAQSFRAHQQVLVALTVCIAFESRISERRVQGPGTELIDFAQGRECALRFGVGGSGLRHQRVDVGELPAARGGVDTGCQQVPGRQDRLQIGKRGEPLNRFSLTGQGCPRTGRFFIV